MSEIIEQVSSSASSLALITSDGNMNRVMKMAEMMASSRVTVPKHLQGSVGDCAAIVIQATNWGMNPFAVAQKTHLVNGVLGYEAQLVNAAIKASNAIKSAFSYEYKDEGGSGANAFISCRVGAVLNGQQDITWGEWLASASVTTKNSPLWKTNVKQQMGYLQVKNWSRLYCPEAILGVMTKEELEDMPQEEKDITPVAEPQPTVTPTLDDATFKTIADKYRESVAQGKKTIEGFISWVEGKGALMTDAQKAEVASWVAKQPEVIEGEAVEVKDDFLNSYEAEESESK
jgi:hypothetical protein